MGSVTPHFEEYPPKASLVEDVYRPFPVLPVGVPPSTDTDASIIIGNALASLAEALDSNDVLKTKSCFLTSQAYWRDLLAFTWHIRTFSDDKTIAPAILELKTARGVPGGFVLDPKSVKDITVSPTLRWLEALFTFETSSPAAHCGGRVVLFPEASDGGIVWKIWVLSTWIDSLVSYPEDMKAIRAPKRNLDDVDTIETDVFILGGGNAGIILAARLKALGVDSVIVDRNEQPGDNWALRYDSLRFHIAKSNCETPYLPYPKEPALILTRQDLADHMKNYAATFDLNILQSSFVEGTSFNESTGIWDVKIHTPQGRKNLKAKHLVQATGIGGSKPYTPDIPGEDLYKGINIHSEKYKNPKTLSDKGVKSLIIVGSANSAFDIMEDCATAGLKTTMNARSPTYIFPWDYALAPAGLGLYEQIPVDLADKLRMSGPAGIGGQLNKGLYANLAAKEADRYKPLAAAGFPVYDSVGGEADLVHHLLERGGGHFNDIGEGIELIVSGKVAVKGSVSPVAYTETGLKFSDGSTVDADAIVWCTGFKDKDRSVTTEVLGGKGFAEASGLEVDGNVLGPQDIAVRRDAVWGVDNEGEVRGVYKRQLRLKNFWIFGGTAAMHRYYSLPVALQIKAEVEGILPEAYRDTPEVI